MSNIKPIIEDIVSFIKHDLRQSRRETYYATAKATGLRMEVIKKLESEPLQGKAESLALYIDNYCCRFPATAYKLFYEAATNAGQQKPMFE